MFKVMPSDKPTSATNLATEKLVERGFLLQQKGQISEAKLIYKKALKLDPYNFNAYQLLGLIMLEGGEFELAIDLLRKAISINPTVTNPQINLANAYFSNKNFEDAIAHYLSAIQINPKLSQPYYGLGLCYDHIKQWDSAIKNYIHAIQIDPNFLDAYLNLGGCLEKKNLFETAIEAYDQAIKIDPTYAMAYNNRGNALKKLSSLKEAMESFKNAILFDPNFALAHSNLGVLYRDLGLLDKSLECFDLALKINPQFNSAKYNKSLALLHSGDFKNGFREYEWRWESNTLRGSQRTYKNPLWLGEEPLEGKTIFIHGEQGLGDIIQFCRYIDLIASIGAKIILEVPDSLINLMSGLPGVVQIISTDGELPYFDYHCPMLSLPLAFKTELSTIPLKIPYLKTSEEKKRKWGKRLGENKKFRVGLVWSGGIRPDQTEVFEENIRRNIPLIKLAQLRHEGIQFYSIQKGAFAELELQELQTQGWSGPEILNFSDELIDFSDTAALIENLDLIVSVDTAVAHLAGALGKSIWLLNRYDSDWRWLLDRDDSPWYPSLKLYRQKEYGDWDNVVENVRTQLIDIIQKNHG
jgi:tetratricopeptide (TPR) repeat protein